MKIKRLSALVVATIQAVIHQAAAQGSAFTYQGHLNERGIPANGVYDISVGLFNTNIGGIIVAGPITNSAVKVSDGLFSITLDYGNVFQGATCWLEIAVRSNAGGSFTTLSPRQQLTPTPYAVFAESANAAGLCGTIPSASLAGGYGSVVNLTNPANRFAGNGSGLTNVNASTLSGLAAASFSQVVNPAQFGAVGNNVADDTISLQNALNFAAYSNGAPKNVRIPPGRYRCTSGLIIPRANELKLVGDDSFNGDSTILDFTTAPTLVNGLTFSSPGGASGGICGLLIEGISVIGRTNGAKGHGIFLGDPSYTTNSGGAPVGRAGIIKNCNVSGWMDGISLYDWETATIDHCGVYYNTNFGIHLVRADSCTIRDCQVGWGLGPPSTPTTTTALGNFGYGLGVHVYGGEWGNCLRRLWQDSGVTVWYGGNAENVSAEMVLLTNTCRYIEIGCRNITGNAVPCWHITCNPGGQPNSGVQIIGSTCEYAFTHRVLVEGYSLSLPQVIASYFIGSPLIEVASSIGGPVTSTYDDNTTLVDKNSVNNWDARQFFKGDLAAGAPAVRIQSGSSAGSMEAGGDTGANTVTANHNKQFSITIPRYANAVGDLFQLGLLQCDTASNDAIARIGTSPGKLGFTRFQIWTAPSEGTVASQHWEVGSAGDLTAAGAENITTGGSIKCQGVTSIAGAITNGAIVWYQTNNTPNLVMPNGSLCTVTDGRFYVRSNNAWVLH